MASLLRHALRTSKNLQRLYIGQLDNLVSHSVAFSGYRHCRWFSGTGRRYEDVRNPDEAMNKIMSSLLVPGISNEQVIDAYDEYDGKEFDKMMEVLDYNGPKRVADAVSSILKDAKDARILDAGAGTGRIGVLLKAAGFTNVDAVEPSSGLLKIAQEKKVYKTTMCQFIGNEALPVNDQTYDMVVLCGVMNEGHLPKEALVDLIRVVKSGGHIVNVFREPALHVSYYGEGLDAYFNQLEQEGKWKLVERTHFPKFVGDVQGIIFVHKIQ